MRCVDCIDKFLRQSIVGLRPHSAMVHRTVQFSIKMAVAGPTGLEYRRFSPPWGRGVPLVREPIRGQLLALHWTV